MLKLYGGLTLCDVNCSIALFCVRVNVVTSYSLLKLLLRLYGIITSSSVCSFMTIYNWQFCASVVMR